MCFWGKFMRFPNMRFPLKEKTSGTASLLMQFPIIPMSREPQGTAWNRMNTFKGKR